VVLQRDEAGTPVGHLETNNDITEREQVQQELRRSEQELRKVLQTIPAMAWIGSADGGNEFVSEGWVEYTGVTLEDTRGALAALGERSSRDPVRASPDSRDCPCFR
jgi:PAS domain-containing protein